MLIALTDPLWQRLYGPYGITNAPGRIAALLGNWADDLAEHFYYEELHHQGDLYPVTYASLPWIWGFAPMPPEGSSSALVFLSYAIECALRPSATSILGTGPRGQYRGLSLNVADHQRNWLPAEQRLGADDMMILQRLEDWLATHVIDISESCLGAITAGDRTTDAGLISAAAALHSGFGVSVAASFWADGVSIDVAVEEALAASERDIQTAFVIARRVGNNNRDLAEFLQSWAERQR